MAEFMEAYEDKVGMEDKSNFNTETGDYITGSFLNFNVPTLKGDKYIEEGSVDIQVFTTLKKPSLVRFMTQSFDKDGNTIGSVSVLLTHEVARDLGNRLSVTLFNPGFEIAGQGVEDAI